VRTPRRRSDQRSKARAATTVQLGPVTREWRPRPVTRGLGALAGGRTAIRHWRRRAARRQPPWHPCRRSCRP
jgi:hypothetical protein